MCRKKLLKPWSARPRGVSSCGWRKTERHASVRRSRANGPRASVIGPGSRDVRSSMCELLRVDHRERARWAAIDAQPAPDAHVFVEQQCGLRFLADVRVVCSNDRDAVVRANVDAQAAQDAEVGVEHDVVETTQAATALQDGAFLVVAGLDLREADAAVG